MTRREKLAGLDVVHGWTFLYRPSCPLRQASPASASLQSTCAANVCSKWGSFARPFSAKAAGNDVIGIDLGTTNSCVAVMEGKLNPPSSEALKRMHMLAFDPGIIAIMNKHKWRVGIMIEMAPVGYVGVSPKCILGFNKNMGEEISPRLRTDDLKGFWKYESINKTLLHELAHMVHSEHDAPFL